MSISNVSESNLSSDIYTCAQKANVECGSIASRALMANQDLLPSHESLRNDKISYENRIKLRNAAIQNRDFEKLKELICDQSHISYLDLSYFFQEIKDEDIFSFIECIGLVKEKMQKDPSTLFQLIIDSSGFFLRDAKTASGSTDLMMAIGQNMFRKFFDLLEFQCVNPHEENSKWGGNALLLCCHPGRYKFLVYLVERFGVAIESTNSSGETPLYKAVALKNEQAICYLLEKGANPNIEIGNGDTPLKCAVRQKNASLINLLIENGAEPNFAGPMNGRGITPLLEAASNGDIDTIERLQSLGCSINYRDLLGTSCMTRAIGGNHTKLVEYLIHQKMELTEDDYRRLVGSNILCKEIPIMESIFVGNAGRFRSLVKAGNNEANKENAIGQNALFAALESDRTWYLQSLLTVANLPADSMDSYNGTPLYKVLMQKRPCIDAIKLLLTYRADPNAENMFGDSPMKVAQRRGITDIVERFRVYIGWKGL